MPSPDRDKAERRANATRDHIRRVLADRKLSQKDACDLAGLRNASALGNYLAGHSQSLNLLTTLQPLAHALGMTTSQFIGEEEPPKPSPEPRITPSSDFIGETRGGGDDGENFKLQLTIQINGLDDLRRVLRSDIIRSAIATVMASETS